MKPGLIRKAAQAVVLLAASGFSLDASAQIRDGFVPWTTILVHGPGCSAGNFTESAFIRLLELELLTDRMQVTLAEAAPTAGLLTVEVPSSVCDAAAREALVTVRATGGARSERPIALGDLTMDARPRALALAVAELIRATRASLEILRVERPPPHYHLAMVPDSPEPAVPPASRTMDLAGFAAWRVYAPAKTSLFGAELAANFALPGTSFALRGDAAGFWKSVDDQLGTVSLSTYTVGFGAFMQTGHNPVVFAGPHVEVGYAQAVGNPNDGEKTTGGRGLVTASVIAGTRAWFHPDWAALLELEGGLTASGLDVRANDRLLAEMRGAWFTARAGIALRP